ncbi:MAG: hypothetical protein C5B55_13555 [Blastocatellia bacterium]|nr:MAG: hypothetical protein C5B55_13555 [Blastocatellia bacterium]
MRAGAHLAISVAFFLLGVPLFGQAEWRAASEDVEEDRWSFEFATMGYVVPHERSYASPTFSADWQHLHTEARYNYENQETGSLWVGYNFSTGQDVALQLTPMLGGVFGKATGIAPGFRFSVTYKKFELSSEGEYVFDTGNRSSNFFYSWNELTYSPADWFHTGLVSQRTRAYQTELDVQRGVSVGFSHNNVDFTTYVFNAGWTDPTFVLSLRFTF